MVELGVGFGDRPAQGILLSVFDWFTCFDPSSFVGWVFYCDGCGQEMRLILGLCLFEDKTDVVGSL